MQAMFMALLLLVLPGCSPAQMQKGMHLDRIEMPPGFEISLYARVPGARSMTLSSGGVLFVGTRDKGSVYAVLDRDKDHVADEVVTVASGLQLMLYRQEAFECRNLSFMIPQSCLQRSRS